MEKQSESVPKWMEKEIAEGMLRLRSLGLNFCPPLAAAQVTLKVWQETIPRHFPFPIEEFDGPRIRAGFRHLEANCREWPKPKDLVDVIPSRPGRKRLPEPPPSPEAQERGKQMIRNILANLES